MVSVSFLRWRHLHDLGLHVVIVGVDPGKVTGVAAWWNPDFFDNSKRPEVETAEVEANAVVPVIRRILDGQRPHLVAVERFTRAPGRHVMSAQSDADRVIGAVRSFCDESLVRCVYQSPGPAKKIAPKDMLKKLGWYTPTPDDHANNALQHILLCLATFHPTVFAQVTDL